MNGAAPEPRPVDLLVGDTRTDAISQGYCIKCEFPVFDTDFKDALSKKEFTISGLCPNCQDKIFKIPE